MFVIISDADDGGHDTQLFNLLCDKADDEHGGITGIACCYEKSAIHCQILQSTFPYMEKKSGQIHKNRESRVGLGFV